MAVMTMVEAIRSALGDAIERDERVLVFGQDVGVNGGMFRATDGLQARFGADRVVDMPLAEAVIVGSAVGLGVQRADPGRRAPVPRLRQPGLPPDRGSGRALSLPLAGRYAMPMVIRAPFGGNVKTPELHSDAHEAKYANTPGLKVVMPATAYDAKGLLAAAIRDPDPVLFCEPLRGYRLISDDVPEEDYTVPLGRARTVRDGCRPRDRRLQRRGRRRRAGGRARGARRATRSACSTCAASCRSTSTRCARRWRGCGRAVVLHEGSLSAGFGGRARGHDPGGGVLVAARADRPRRGVRHAVSAGQRSRTSTCRRSSACWPRCAPRWRRDVEFRLPDVGEGIASAEIVEWLVAEGDTVREHQDLVEIQTDKAVVEIPSPATGVVVPAVRLGRGHAGRRRAAGGDRRCRPGPSGRAATDARRPRALRRRRRRARRPPLARRPRGARPRRSACHSPRPPPRRPPRGAASTRRLASQLGVDRAEVRARGPTAGAGRGRAARGAERRTRSSRCAARGASSRTR